MRYVFYSGLPWGPASTEDEQYGISERLCGHVERLVGVLEEDIIHLPVSPSLKKYLCAQSVSFVMASPT